MGDTFGLVGSVVSENGKRLTHRIVVEAQSHHQTDPHVHLRVVTSEDGVQGQKEAWAALPLEPLDELIDLLQQARIKMTGG